MPNKATKSKSLQGDGKCDDRKTNLIVCAKCNFQSNRRYNVDRHHNRIHGEKKTKCFKCDKIFRSKCAYYTHAEKLHPGERKSCYTSRIKYGITRQSLLNGSIPAPIPDDRKKLRVQEKCWTAERVQVRVSERIKNKKVTKLHSAMLNENIKFAKSIQNIEDVPLSSFFEDQGLKNYFKNLISDDNVTKCIKKSPISSPLRESKKKKVHDTDSNVNIVSNQLAMCKSQTKSDLRPSALPIKKRALRKFMEMTKENKTPFDSDYLDTKETYNSLPENTKSIHNSDFKINIIIDPETVSLYYEPYQQFMGKFNFDNHKVP